LLTPTVSIRAPPRCHAIVTFVFWRPKSDAPRNRSRQVLLILDGGSEAFLACVFKQAHIASQIPGGNQDAQTNHLLQCNRTCGYNSINLNRGFRYRVGSNHAAASVAAV